jgi:hypothetical protein
MTFGPQSSWCRISSLYQMFPVQLLIGEFPTLVWLATVGHRCFTMARFMIGEPVLNSVLPAGYLETWRM